MDDLSLYTNKFDDRIEQLKLTLSTLRENRFSCNPKKTELAYSRIEYLGFLLSADGIQMSEKRIEAIGKITAPRNVKGLQRTLGLFNFWRKFVPSCSRNSFYMRQLLRKDVKFQWTKECDRELEYLKEALTKPPILRPIDPRLPIYIQVDGSKQGYGAAILQRDVDGNFCVIQYGAKATNPAQQQYNSDDLECLGLIYSLELIEPIAVNKPIIVITDNSHLLHLNTWTPINARQKRMIAYLMQFNLTISYVNGSRNATADCLSRLFTDASPKERLRNAPATIRDEEKFLFAATTRSAARRQAQTGDVQTAPDGVGPTADRGRRDYAVGETVNGAADDSHE